MNLLRNSNYAPPSFARGEAPLPSQVEPDIRVEEERLLLRVAGQDVLAFECLYDRLARPMFALVLRLVASRYEAEDIVQEGFCVVWFRADEYQPSLGSPYTWIATIMWRKAIDRMRRYARREKYEAGVLALLPEQTEDLNGAASIIAQECHEKVMRALAELPTEEKGVLKLHFFEGLTLAQISFSLRIPLSTVRDRIRRGRVKLRAKLAGLRSDSSRPEKMIVRPIRRTRNAFPVGFVPRAGAQVLTQHPPRSFTHLKQTLRPEGYA